MNIKECKIQKLLNDYDFFKNKEIKSGLFKNMMFDVIPTEGCYLPKLLGVYEQPLQEFLKNFPINSYERLINIGCAEGFYAVGFATKYKNLEVIAFDIEENARKTTKHLADTNKTNIIIHDLFDINTFSKYIDKKSIIFCDIESSEKVLLNPAINPDILHYDFIVESHEFMDNSITDILIKRFEKTHNIYYITDNKERNLSEIKFLETLKNEEILSCIEESRPGPTPWLVMIKK
jgi:hypothetical protein